MQEDNWEIKRTCHKKGWGSKQKALKRLKEIMAEHKGLGVKHPKRIYRCHICSDWHLTSMSKKKQEKVMTDEWKQERARLEELKQEADFWARRYQWK